jgi:hypothetical protein
MKHFLFVTLIAGGLGGFAAYGLLDLLQEPKEMKIGEFRIPVDVRKQLYDRDEFLLGVFASGAVAAALAAAFGAVVGSGRRRRR